MKSTSAFFFSFLTLFMADLSAQNNVGIGTSSPSNKLEVHGNLLVTAQTLSTNTAPTVAQTKTMINNSTITFSAADSTGRFYDPGGSIGDYIANITYSKTFINAAGSGTSIQLWIESIGLAEGDTLIIRPHEFGPVLLAIGGPMGGGMNTTTGSFIFNFMSLDIRFTSDGNINSVGPGFGILYKRLYPEPNPSAAQNFSGNTFFFDAGKGALQGGAFTEAPDVGNYSVSLGFKNRASGETSIALGYVNQATGDHTFAVGYQSSASSLYSAAMGFSTESSGISSTALGYQTEATGFVSTAMGSFTNAIGSHSTALGSSTTARGYASTSMGVYNQANGHGCTAIGVFNDPIVNPQGGFDLTQTTPLFIVGNGDDYNSTSNAFVVRKDGHVGLGTNNPRVTLHIADGRDAGLADTAGFMLIGNVNGLNILMDDNEIMARDDGDTSDLFLQKDGGKVFIGNPVSPSYLLSVNGTAGKPGSGSWATYSDRRLKENIESYADGLDEVLQIRPVTYQYNSKSGYNTQPTYVGVIAQELQEVAPYMVTPAENVRDDGSPGFLTIDNSAMTYMLINAVKELHAENITLKTQYEESQRAHASLEAEVRSIKQLINAHSTTTQK